jgi:hypothetical protein
VAALVLEASAHAHAQSQPAGEPAAPIVPRRRGEAAPADETLEAARSDEPPPDEHSGRGAGLRRLAGRRQSDR